MTTRADAGIPLTAGAQNAISTVMYLDVQPYLSNPVLAWPSPAPASAAAAPASYPPAMDLEAPSLTGGRDVRDVYPDASQGSNNTCSAFAATHAYALKYALTRPLPADVPSLSAVYAYYFQRVEECKTAGVCSCPTCGASGSSTCCAPPCIDCGSYLRSVVTVFKAGVCTTRTWPLGSPLDELPSAAAVAEAPRFKITGVQQLQLSAAEVCSALASRNPVLVFLLLTPQQRKWMNAQTGSPSTSASQVLLPSSEADASRRDVVGHVVVATGYTASTLTLRNSFGLEWGFRGSFVMPLANFAAGQVHSAAAVLTIEAPGGSSGL